MRERQAFSYKRWMMPQGSIFHPFQLTRVNTILLLIHTVFVASLLTVLFVSPDLLGKVLSKLALRYWDSFDDLLETRDKFYLDILILWMIGFVFIMFDALSRNVRGAALVRALFFARRNDSTSPSQTLLMTIFVSSFVFGPALVIINLGRNVLGTGWLVVEDGPLETATAAGFIIAAVVLAHTSVRIYRRRSPAPLWHGFVLAVVAVATFVVGMEEISWGQRILGFETHEVLSQINTQDEFNIHNILNPYFRPIYVTFSLLLFAVVCFSCWLFVTKSPLGRFGEISRILPDGSLIFLVALILPFTNHGLSREMVEQISTLVVVLYSVRIFVQARHATAASADRGPSP